MRTSEGQRFDIESVTLTNEAVDEFAPKFDPRHSHDPTSASEGMFGGVIASGFHTVSIVWGACILSNCFSHIAVGTEMDYIKWPAPVYLVIH
ncbi:MaoC/PaaZ C-terminal domain-containing protein [Alicyclobacillus ferrooxydans]|uniref:MaoC-like domain-containing protein n=1 Tax=Alicyclobacillus ferrooxydans TaxID=471514 RepID=A0A0P9F2S1_9BACL|nr:hypothetical protein AN477_01975 [Alicyclobacillus ferrooxydans]